MKDNNKVNIKHNLKHRKAAVKEYSRLNKKIKKLGKLKDLDNIIELIKTRNGWTTIAEFQFNQAAIDSLSKRLDLFVRDMKAFTNASAKIGRS